MKTLSEFEAKNLYSHHAQEEFFDELIKFITSGNVCAVLVKTDVEKGEDKKLKQLVGPKNIDEAINAAPTSFRAIFGTDNIKNGNTKNFRLKMGKNYFCRGN